MTTTRHFSWGALIQRGEHKARIVEEADGQWKLEFDGRTSFWPTRDDAEEEAEKLLREVAGPNATLQGAPFGEG